MSDSRPPVVFLLGPSGAGKSTLGRWLAEDAKLHHLEIDQFPHADGIDTAGLRTEWEEFISGVAARPLVEAIRSRALAAGSSGAVLSFPSLLVLSAQQLSAVTREGVTVIILYCPASECIAAFLCGEKQRPRVQGTDPVHHWVSNNRDSYIAFSRPEFASIRLEVFRNGARTSRPALVSGVLERCAA
jgi:shikimate kinase